MSVRQAERDAAKLLESSWWNDDYSDSPLPVDPARIARGLGIRVRLQKLPMDESGNIVIPVDGTPRITLNEWDATNRQRFTCAHEIGHYLRRSEQGNQTETFKDYRDTLAGLGVSPEEVYANQFAAALLMPAHLVQRFYERGDSVERLARIFKTSEQAMELRLRNLRLA